MAELQKMVYFDDEVASQVLSIVREAKKYVVVVSPYIELWRHAQDAIALAIDKGVDVTFIVRSEPKVIESDSVAWLVGNKVKVLAVEYLHAKIYINESSVIVSSMNLLKSSAQNSKEIALSIRTEQEAGYIGNYVYNTLMRLATPVGKAETENAGPALREPAKPQLRGNVGVCIRCGRNLFLNPAKPLCDECYDMWAQWEDEDYPEKVCHFCGRPSNVSYGKPLCGECYRSLR